MTMMKYDTIGHQATCCKEKNILIKWVLFVLSYRSYLSSHRLFGVLLALFGEIPGQQLPAISLLSQQWL
jgi:hypothetical protein